MSLGSPKSEAGKRDIPLNDNRVFVSVYGGTVHNHAVNRAISGALVRLEKQGKPMEHFTAHALRDTFATRYIEQVGRHCYPNFYPIFVGYE